ncbi:polysaccharide biosynthesis/export family protein [Christiangramia flava]|uniref:Polysaccharide export outer membrane protein n=1 Tax=Christiangramia flava JLT2011 TaxID=1229726 RepID=A0A1L7HZM2_9FLAO|nr:polysaccharide biosynthesis/export family protein [Christiangramia flava]APU66796.1 Polysaccharide export outer membrane protein [Christiangramia flava JLT2011]OSS38433.1 Polysaccharide export outer membrane protein [Christiangramia flava JLT2011]
MRSIKSVSKYLYLSIISIFLLGSCATRDEVVYFQEPESLQGYQNLMDYEPTIQKNDVLRIDVSSRNEEVVKPFQKNSNGQQSGGQSGNMSLTGYLVDPKGFIQFPVFGNIEAAGKTRGEFQAEIEDKVRTMVTDAVVTVRIINFSVTVLGEVGSPGRVQVQDGRLTLPELFASVGDISYSGLRENIVVIREQNGEKSVGRVDMTSADVFKNPFYYLKQNDVVYVEPTYKQVKSAGFITSYTGIFSLIASITGLVLLFSK